VHKFGGASLADADLYRTVGDLLMRESSGRVLPPAAGDDVVVGGGEGEAAAAAAAGGRHSGPIPTMAIVSARAGMTDMLVAVVESALSDIDRAESALDDAVNGQVSMLRDLAPPDAVRDSIEAGMREDARDILSVVRSLRMIRSVPPSVMEVVTGYGEIWSARTLYAYLRGAGARTAWLDARDVLVVRSDGGKNAGLGEKGSSSSTRGVIPVWAETARRMEGWWDTVGRAEGVNYYYDASSSSSSSSSSGGGDADEEEGGASSSSSSSSPPSPPIVVVTGFVATTADGVPTTLKRSGSDYSATIFAKLVASSRVTMWKNTDGVYTADPRRVPEAFSIASLKYDEAMELAYFGAQVLHPSAMVPCIDSNIPVYVRNIFNPAFAGTVIQGRCASLSDVNQDGKVVNWRSRKGEIPIKGITSVDRVSLLTLEGASVIGGAEVAERFMGTMASAGIDVLMVTQASSESSITVVVPENQGATALSALRSAFELELSRSNVNSICLTDVPMAIVAIVGEGMAMRSGVSASFMSSLAKANVNIRVIAQGSSERQVAVVVEAKDVSRALRAAHMVFTLSQTMVSVAILGGTGKVGSALVRQLVAQKESLAKNLNFGVGVNAIASSTRMIMGKNGKCLMGYTDVDQLLGGDDSRDLDMEVFTASLESDVNPHRVVVDCTNDDGVADMYERWMSSGVNVISPGRWAASGPLGRYRAIQKAQRANTVEWQYESSVGSALPVLSTLRDLVQTGDEVQLLRGCLSGTMAYIFYHMDEGLPFSEAVRRAIDQDFAELDVREDLSGLDVCRKIVILARELGMDVSVEDVEVESLIPDEIRNREYVGTKEEKDAAIVEDLKALDATMLERYREAMSGGENLRYKFVIDVVAGKCRCGLVGVDNKDTLFRLRDNENLVAFETSRYTTSPLIIKGAAAGPDLAASGMFADLLRLGRAFVGSQA
jgi:aspartokinase/homoserine dehydrogenase 1